MTVSIKKPRGRCPECGKDYSLRNDGTVGTHGWDGRRDCAGVNRAPMTIAECVEWDERARLEEQGRQERRRVECEERDRIEDERILALCWFRTFDDDSFEACPWRSDRVTFIAIGPRGPLTSASRRREKEALLRSQYTILVAWPGEWRQDIFLLDDEAKRRALKTIAAGVMA
jgi:hypothetical protein